MRDSVYTHAQLDLDPGQFVVRSSPPNRTRLLATLRVAHKRSGTGTKDRPDGSLG